MKVLHISPWYAPAWASGGTAVAATNLCEELSKQGIDISVFTTTDMGGEKKISESTIHEERRGVSVTYFSCGIFGSTKRQAALSWELCIAIIKNTRKFDLVHIHSTRHIYGLAASYACRRANVPYIITPHASLMDFWVTSVGTSFFKKPYLKLIEKIVLSNANSLHYLSDFERSSSRKWSYNSSSVVIPNGIHSTEFEIDSTINRTKKPIKLIHVGRVHPQKNTLAMIQAVGEFPASDVLLDIVGAVGDESFYKECTSFIDSNNVKNIRFLGFKPFDDVQKLYMSYDLFCMPSLCEGVSMALIEAASWGLPCLVSNQVGNHVEIAEDNAGLICETRVDSIIANLNRLLEDEKLLPLLKKGALDSSRKRYSLVKNVSSLKREYTLLLQFMGNDLRGQ